MQTSKEINQGHPRVQYHLARGILYVPFLDIQSRVLNDEVLGTGHCSNCGGTTIQLAIAAITTQENIHSQIGTTQGFPEKRKFSVI